MDEQVLVLSPDRDFIRLRPTAYNRILLDMEEERTLMAYNWAVDKLVKYYEDLHKGLHIAMPRSDSLDVSFELYRRAQVDMMNGSKTAQRYAVLEAFVDAKKYGVKLKRREKTDKGHFYTGEIGSHNVTGQSRIRIPHVGLVVVEGEYTVREKAFNGYIERKGSGSDAEWVVSICYKATQSAVFNATPRTLNLKMPADFKLRKA